MDAAKNSRRIGTFFCDFYNLLQKKSTYSIIHEKRACRYPPSKYFPNKKVLSSYREPIFSFKLLAQTVPTRKKDSAQVVDLGHPIILCRYILFKIHNMRKSYLRHWSGK